MVNVVVFIFLHILQGLVFMQKFFTVQNESHIDFQTQSVIMTLEIRRGRGRGLSLRTFWNSEKLSNFKAHELSCRQFDNCHEDVIIIDNLRNLRFYQRSSKNMDKKSFTLKVGFSHKKLYSINSRFYCFNFFISADECYEA